MPCSFNVAIVVRDVLRDRAPQLRLAEDDHPNETLLLDRTDEPL